MEKILDSGRWGGELQYLVKWQGQPFEESTVIRGTARLCQESHRSHLDAPRIPTKSGYTRSCTMRSRGHDLRRVKCDSLLNLSLVTNKSHSSKHWTQGFRNNLDIMNHISWFWWLHCAFGLLSHHKVIYSTCFSFHCCLAPGKCRHLWNKRNYGLHSIWMVRCKCGVRRHRNLSTTMLMKDGLPNEQTRLETYKITQPVIPDKHRFSKFCSSRMVAWRCHSLLNMENYKSDSDVQMITDE